MSINYNPNLLSNPMTGIATQFGMPTCILGLGADLLALLPGDVLLAFDSALAEGMQASRSAIANVSKAIFQKFGILEYDSETGELKFISDSSRNGVDGVASTLAAGVGTVMGVLAVGGALAQSFGDQLDAINNCVGSFEDWMKGGVNRSVVDGPEDLAVSPGQLAMYEMQVKVANDFLDDCTTTQKYINKILMDRAADPSLEPLFESEIDEGPIFRLDFGPPQSKQGQFLLSVDGLYYDSQTRTYADGEEVPTTADLQFVPAAEKWTLDHSPNLGGRGGSYSLEDLGRYVDTIFDINHIDESDFIKVYYTADHFLQVLISQKNKRLDDIHSNLKDLRLSGYGPDSAMYLNYEQQIISEGASFTRKINKRKKQIEVAVKTPDLYGSTVIYQPGEVPINNFSFLSSINLNIEMAKQKNLSFDHGEVSGVVLPIVPKFVRANESTQNVVITPLMVAPIGAGSTIDGEELETQAPVLSLVTGITTEGLIAVYNFTDVNIQTPESTTFNTLNCNASGVENRAQTVSTSPPLLFQKGLGIPYLNGMVSLDKPDINYSLAGETFNNSNFEIADAGNYVRLPDSNEYRDLLYSTSGATINFWTYMPGLHQQEGGFWEHPYETSAFDFNLSSSSGKWANAHYYRVLLGCENTGGITAADAASSITLTDSSEFVKGVLMGWSRDPRMYYDGSAVVPGSNDFNPRENFGAIVDSIAPVSATPTAHGYTTGDTGTWHVSSNGTYSFGEPIAFQQASGTFSVGAGSSINFSLKYPGDGYTASSHDANVWLYTSGLTTSGPAFGGASGVSGTLGISYYDTGSDRTLNIGTPSTVFFIAPTRSYNGSAVGFAKGFGCETTDSEILKFVVSDKTTVDGNSLEDCIDKFINISIVCDPKTDKILLYVNGSLIKTGVLSTLFGKDSGGSPQVPTFVSPRTSTTSSFEYKESTVNQKAGVDLFDTGPLNNTFFTPWIVGGGWTDGRPVNLDTSSGGFLDPGAGLISSYNGYVGSLKIYSKALDNNEVLTNYTHQKTFFENIDL